MLSASKQLTRRKFLKNSAQATLVASLSRSSFASTKSKSTPGKTTAGDWPMYRGNKCLTGRAVLPGEMKTAPNVAWQHRVEGGLVSLKLHPAPGRNFPEIEVQKNNIPANYFQSSEGTKWKQGPPSVDLYGTGQMVPDPGRAAKLLKTVPGLQTVEFQPAPEAKGLDPKQAVCFAYDGGKKREVWRSEVYDTIQNTNFAIADIDHDGNLEVILTPHYRVIVYDGQTGRTKHLLKIHDYRNYGFFCCTDLSGKGLLDIVIIADFAMHMDVVRNEGDHLRLLWRQDIEKEIQSKSSIVRPGPNPVCDVNGDGRKEIIFNLFNHTGDGKWHLMGYDALTGQTVFDLPEHYLSGAADVDGDGVLELFTTRTRTLHVPGQSKINILQIRGGNSSTVWEHPRAQWVTAPSTLPLTHSTMVAHGTDDLVTATLAENGKSNFFILETLGQKGEKLSALGLDSRGSSSSILEYEFPLRSRPSVRSVSDVDGDGVDEILVSFSQSDSKSARLGKGRNVSVQAVQIETIPSQQQFQGSGATRPIVSATILRKEKPLIFFEGANNQIVALQPPARSDSKPTPLWSLPGAGPVVMADVNGDGVLEVIFADASDEGEGQIVAADPRNGHVLWRHTLSGFPGPHPEWNFGGITTWWVGNYTSRNHLDVWASARRSTMHSDEAWLLRGQDGKALWHLREVRTDRTPKEGRGWGAGGSLVCSADVDGDGLDDIITLYPVNYMAAKGTDGKLLHSVESSAGLFPGVWGAYCSPIVADFNGDGINELLWCGSYHHGLTTLDAKVLWYHKGGASIAGFGDVDADGKMELGFTGWQEGHGLRCLNAATGDLKWELPLPGNPNVPVYTADINGDGKDEFLFCVGKELYAVNDAGGFAGLVWKKALPSTPGTLALADIDHDGKTEILFMGDDSVIYCLDA